jgi:hypothetical protein
MPEKQVCAFCRNTGQHGARWVLKIGNDRMAVHKPCGQRLIEQAPKGIEVTLFPSKGLADEIRAQRFWREKFAEAENARAARTRHT